MFLLKRCHEIGSFFQIRAIVFQFFNSSISLWSSYPIRKSLQLYLFDLIFEIFQFIFVSDDVSNVLSDFVMNFTYVSGFLTDFVIQLLISYFCLLSFVFFFTETIVEHYGKGLLGIYPYINILKSKLSSCLKYLNFWSLMNSIVIVLIWLLAFSRVEYCYPSLSLQILRLLLLHNHCTFSSKPRRMDRVIKKLQRRFFAIRKKFNVDHPIPLQIKFSINSWLH